MSHALLADVLHPPKADIASATALTTATTRSLVDLATARCLQRRDLQFFLAGDEMHQHRLPLESQFHRFPKADESRKRVDSKSGPYRKESFVMTTTIVPTNRITDKMELDSITSEIDFDFDLSEVMSTFSNTHIQALQPGPTMQTCSCVCGTQGTCNTCSGYSVCYCTNYCDNTITCNSCNC